MEFNWLNVKLSGLSLHPASDQLEIIQLWVTDVCAFHWEHFVSVKILPSTLKFCIISLLFFKSVFSLSGTLDEGLSMWDWYSHLLLLEVCFTCGCSTLGEDGWDAESLPGTHIRMESERKLFSTTMHISKKILITMTALLKIMALLWLMYEHTSALPSSSNAQTEVRDVRNPMESLRQKFYSALMTIKMLGNLIPLLFKIWGVY